jgi:hypothetical protein
MGCTHTALEKVEGKPQLPADIQQTYSIYMERLQLVIDEINRTASRERARNARPFDRFWMNFHRFQAHIRQYVPRRFSKEGERRKTDGA